MHKSKITKVPQYGGPNSTMSQNIKAKLHKIEQKPKLYYALSHNDHY